MKPTLLDLFLRGVNAYNNPRLLNYKTGDSPWISISSTQASYKVRHLALGFDRLAIRSGDRAAILSENRPDWILSDLALVTLGAVTVPIYTTQSLPQIEFILSFSDLKMILISSGNLYERVLPVLEKLRMTSKVITFDKIQFSRDIPYLKEIEGAGKQLDKQDPNRFETFRSKLDPRQLATIIYTTSETGEAKGVMLTHDNIASNVLASAKLFDFSRRNDTALSYLPLSHIFERATLYHYLYRQISVCFVESIDRMPDYLYDVRPTIITTVPRFLEKAYERLLARRAKMSRITRKIFDWALNLAKVYDPEKKPSFRKHILYGFADWLVYSRWRARFGGRFRFMICGGSKLRPEIARIYTAIGIPLLQGYGLTETSPVIAVNVLRKNRIGSVGQVLSGVKVRIAADGEILVTGPNVTQGYYKNEKATRAVFEGEWFKTGDLGYLDTDGFLYVTERKKDLIKTSGGKFIAPQAIERLFRLSPYVADVVVIGDERKFATALIFPNFDHLNAFAKKEKVHAKSEQELLGHPAIKQLYEKIVHDVNKHLAHWETIKKFAVIPEMVTLPSESQAATPKAKRKTLQEKYRLIVEALYHEK